ncbi:anhydro-N-acetylmuramic acid kinase AnmK [Wohlfahrtiimonas chitiniclastica]|uniref:anhydro-N-acetylmuramic acid kinase AnmK n=1 Tax=Wohlfahrtiimonas chitiniclastica TaxID=400946 RepID=UPI001BD02116|nr:anhydro-N-acetylmuramic acid kinase AnmK [Wohlfahrtiimonas chitiniclastica]MBS7816211.1 anhydro-N-acetylmuramic acid kinase [Wohlfahrtiimonas chitiniclastica]MBS7821794.1 anhydro-N-acetylmuramic acid kinase [Wohlfahrtiimonas chitiniclastica]MBS7829586.1 anhydro-N-acetylmuramic acid kinase [Wohlfahrtiimonas chitiniclastica]MBS7831553.1 anhydro-N-acetylmuramic acid kinase [Wohlfahrtiimonas chitiniclastica]
MAYGIGIMSGTSLDGIDVALVKIKGINESTQCTLIHYDSYPYDEHIRAAVLRVSHPETSNVAELCALNFELGKLYSDAVSRLLKDHDFKSPLDFIAMHGQTIYHIPKATDEYCASTLQIGDPARLAYDHHTTVISNFRPMDMMAGGQGAPLVPYTEYLLLRSTTHNRLLQNIGGIGNITVLPKNCTMDEVFAFDTGPGNMMINGAMQYFYQLPYDDQGQIAARGQVIPELLNDLMNDPYFKESPPKATGRELFGETRIQSICEQYANQADNVIATFTELTAKSIANAIEQFIQPMLALNLDDELIIAGGGAYNLHLVSRIEHYLPMLKVKTQEDIGLNSDAKEAVAFAVLGHQTLNRQPSNLTTATGAAHSMILGNITLNPWGD